MQYEEIKKLSKADLHVHLDGSLRPKSLIELADLNNISIPSHDIEELKERLGFTKKYKSLEDCLKVFNLTTSLMRITQGLYRTAFELVQDSAEENIKYIEVRFCPHLHETDKLSTKEVLDIVLCALDNSGRFCGIKTGIIICGIRNLLPKLSVEMAELAAEYKNKGVVGFDLAGAERDFPASIHKEALSVVRDAGLGITIHAGESAGPDSIKEALDYGAKRIGHGCRAVKDPKLVQRLVDENITLECCITSNWQTGTVSNILDHPIKRLLRDGVAVTVNTDNRLVHDTTLTQELFLCKLMGMSHSEIKQIIDNGFKAGFKHENYN